MTSPGSGGMEIARGARVAPRTVLAIASMGVFMAFLDNTVVSIAFPNLLESFPGIGLSTLSWVLNAYGIVFAALLVPAGRIADLIGRRRLFSAGTVVFACASLLCAVAPTAQLLIAARAVQGAGAAMLVPASLALVLQANPGRTRAPAVAAWSATGVVAAGIGPSLGGLLIELSDWRLVFLVNVPIGLVVWRLSGRLLVESRAPGRRAWPDLTGALLLTVAIAALVLAIVQAKDWGLLSLGVLGALAVAIVSVARLVHRSRRHPAPVVDLALLRRRTFAITGGLTLVGSISFYAGALTNLLYLMVVWRYSSLEAGLAFTPAPFAAAAAAVLAGRWVADRDARPLLLVGALLCASAALWLALRAEVEPDFLGVYFPAAMVGAVGLGLTFPVISDAAVADAPGGRFAAATALNTGIRELGAAVGIALCVAVLNASLGDLDAFDHVWYFNFGCSLLLGIAVLFTGRITATPTAAGSLGGALAVAALSSPPVAPVVSANGGGSRAAGPGDGAPVGFDELAGLPPEVLERTHPVHLPGGEWLFRQGDAGDALYIVERGRIEIIAEPPGQEAHLIRELGPGAVVGELALISGSPRSASLRARRDSTLLRLDHEEFDALVQEHPDFSRTLLRRLAREVESNRPKPAPGRDVAGVVASFTAGEDDACRRAAERFVAEALSTSTDTLVLDERVGHEQLAEALERAERRHDQVLLLAGAPGTPWAAACARQCDRAIVVVGAVPEPGSPVRDLLPRGADVALAGRAGGLAEAALLADIGARSSQRIRPGEDGRRDAAALARRVTGRSVGLVLSGGGARSFAHIGVIEELLAAGILIDRIAGASMGAFIGALMASGLAPDEIDECCYQEWVRRNPANDYRLPRVSLIRGQRMQAMLERVLPATFEELVRPFLCVTTDLISGELVVHRRGPLPLAVGAGMALPAFAPPVRLDDRLLVDGGVIDNLPVGTMAADGEGPVIASDVGQPEDRHMGRLDAPERDPSIPETLYRLVLLQTVDTQAAARRHAQLVIFPEQDGVGRLEFHQLDYMRQQGRQAAATALETAPPEVFGR